MYVYGLEPHVGNIARINPRQKAVEESYLIIRDLFFFNTERANPTTLLTTVRFIPTEEFTNLPPYYCNERK